MYKETGKKCKLVRKDIYADTVINPEMDLYVTVLVRKVYGIEGKE